MDKVYILGIGEEEQKEALSHRITLLRSVEGIFCQGRLEEKISLLTGQSDNLFPFETVEEAVRMVEEQKDRKEIAVAVAEDSLYYDIFSYAKKKRPEWTVKVIPGKGTAALMTDFLGQTIGETAFMNFQEKKQTRGSVALMVMEHKKTFFMCNRERNTAWLARILLDYGMNHVRMNVKSDFIGENVKVIKGSPAQIARRRSGDLSMVMVENPRPEKAKKKILLQNEDYIKGEKALMDEELRAILLIKMGITPDSVIWSIGKNIGSLSVECARQCPYGEVHSVTESEEAISWFEKNKNKFGTDQLFYYNDEVLDTLSELPMPDIVFIDGASGNIREILAYIAGLDMKIRVVILTNALELIAECTRYLEKYDKDYALTQVITGKTRKTDEFRKMEFELPAAIFEAVI